MIKLYESDILELIPKSLHTPEVQAYSYALKRMNQKLLNYINHSMLITGIDGLPDYILDVLAADLRTQYYDNTLPIEVKRNLIRNSLIWYTKAGTPAAVEELINAVFGEGKVIEWYMYHGEPYSFKIQTSASMTDENIKNIETMIEEVKNKRSWLDSIEFLRSAYVNFHAAGKVVAKKKYIISQGENDGRV